MGFIRIKKIKGHEYAYIVENKWYKRKKGTRQKVSKYIGKVVKLDKENEIDFFEFIGRDADEYVGDSANKRENVLQNLMAWELFRHGFEKNGSVFMLNDLKANADERKVLNQSKREVCLAINEGLLSGFTLSRIMRFRKTGEEDGYKLAKLFVEAGLEVPQDVFVMFYSRCGIK